MEDIKSIIYDFIGQYTDFVETDKESGYENVYRPSWHISPLQFWFNPPFDESGESFPTLSGTIYLLNDGEIMVEDVRTKMLYNIDDCLGDSIQNFVFSINNSRHEGAL